MARPRLVAEFRLWVYEDGDFMIVPAPKEETNAKKPIPCRYDGLQGAVKKLLKQHYNYVIDVNVRPSKRR